MIILPYGRFWAIYDHSGALVCITVYKKGALEVVHRLTALIPPNPKAQTLVLEESCHEKI